MLGGRAAPSSALIFELHLFPLLRGDRLINREYYSKGEHSKWLIIAGLK
jgi:hypothetical protein